MSKFTHLNRIKKQAELIETLADRVNGDIRKLTVRECMRLQTVPEWYEFPVSDSQAYKMLGNGWTVDVIAHILKGLKEAKEDGEYENWID